MKSLYHIVALIALSWLLLAGCSRQQPALQASNGTMIPLAALQDKWVVVNYWASWCEACAEEIPQLNAFNRQIQQSNVVLLGVNYDALSPTVLSAAVKKAGIHYAVLSTDVSALWQLPQPTALPVTYILAPGGRLVETILGATTAQVLTTTLHNLQQSATRAG